MVRATAGFALVLAVLATACGGGDGARPSLLFGDAEGISEQPVAGGVATTLIAVPSKTDTFRDPALSPDGKRVAYVHAPPYTRSGPGYLDAHSDLWIAGRDGTNPTMVYEHSRPTETLTSPHWLDDTTILVHSTYRVDPTVVGGPSALLLTRINITTGERTDLIEDVVAFAVSPDGSRVAFTAIESIEEQPIYIAGVDGSEAVLLVDYATGLAAFSGLLFSEDGSTLYFGAHEEDEKVRLASNAILTVGAREASRMSATHDAPVDLWATDIVGGEPRLVAEIEVTDPHFARGDTPDDLYLLAGWLGHIEISTGEVTELADPDVSGGAAFAND